MKIATAELLACLGGRSVCVVDRHFITTRKGCDAAIVIEGFEMTFRRDLLDPTLRILLDANSASVTDHHKRYQK